MLEEAATAYVNEGRSPEDRAEKAALVVALHESGSVCLRDSVIAGESVLDASLLRALADRALHDVVQELRAGVQEQERRASTLMPAHAKLPQHVVAAGAGASGTSPAGSHQKGGFISMLKHAPQRKWAQRLRRGSAAGESDHRASDAALAAVNLSGSSTPSEQSKGREPQKQTAAATAKSDSSKQAAAHSTAAQNAVAEQDAAHHREAEKEIPFRWGLVALACDAAAASFCNDGPRSTRDIAAADLASLLLSLLDHYITVSQPDAEINSSSSSSTAALSQQAAHCLLALLACRTPAMALRLTAEDGAHCILRVLTAPAAGAADTACDILDALLLGSGNGAPGETEATLRMLDASGLPTMLLDSVAALAGQEPIEKADVHAAPAVLRALVVVFQHWVAAFVAPLPGHPMSPSRAASGGGDLLERFEAYGGTPTVHAAVVRVLAASEAGLHSSSSSSSSSSTSSSSNSAANSNSAGDTPPPAPGTTRVCPPTAEHCRLVWAIVSALGEFAHTGRGQSPSGGAEGGTDKEGEAGGSSTVAAAAAAVRQSVTAASFTDLSLLGQGRSLARALFLDRSFKQTVIRRKFAAEAAAQQGAAADGSSLSGQAGSQAARLRSGTGSSVAGTEAAAARRARLGRQAYDGRALTALLRLLETSDHSAVVQLAVLHGVRGLLSGADGGGGADGDAPAELTSSQRWQIQAAMAAAPLCSLLGRLHVLQDRVQSEALRLLAFVCIEHHASPAADLSALAACLLLPAALTDALACSVRAAVVAMVTADSVFLSALRTAGVTDALADLVVGTAPMLDAMVALALGGSSAATTQPGLRSPLRRGSSAPRFQRLLGFTAGLDCLAWLVHGDTESARIVAHKVCVPSHYNII
jgi:hypothetical protein